MKPGDYANGRTFLGWKVSFTGNHIGLSSSYDSREKAFAAKPFFKGPYTRRITRVYVKDSPVRAALRALLAECQLYFCGTTPAEQRAKEILGL